MVTTNLCAVLERAWQMISEQYDINTSLPDRETVLHDVDLALPAAAAEALMVNLITEAMECVDRFSPWYKEPAQTFGLVLAQNGAAEKPHWGLSIEARQRYQLLLDEMMAAAAGDTRRC